MTFQEKEKKKFRLNKSLHVQFNTIRCNMNQLTYIECKQKNAKAVFKYCKLVVLWSSVVKVDKRVSLSAVMHKDWQLRQER